MPDVAAILSDLEHRERVPLAGLSRQLGVSKNTQHYAVAQGLLKPVRAPIPGTPGHPYVIGQEDASRLLLATVLAVAAGVAIAVILRGLVGAGVPGPAAAAMARSLRPG